MNLWCLLAGHAIARWIDPDGRSVTCLRCGRTVVDGQPCKRLSDLYR